MARHRFCLRTLNFSVWPYALFIVKGALYIFAMESNRSLSDLTWLRVGGPAELFFQPKSIDQLSDALRSLDPSIPVFPLGLGSNVIVRDGGIRGLVIRLSPRGFGHIEIDGDDVIAGAAALDSRVALAAADAGLDLTFLRTIPGSIGGAVRMNAGCYGSYVADVFESAEAVLRDGTRRTFGREEMQFAYRQSSLPEGAILTRVRFRAPKGHPETLAARMQDQIAKRDASQPAKDRSAGSTFRNPAGFSSTGRADDVQDLKAWKVIDNAGLRGAVLGGAQMSPKHSNFLINTGTATALDLEALGEIVRKRVYADSGLTLDWEIMRVGDFAPGDDLQAILDQNLNSV